uniref:Uncharacterized protein n=1 Tax=Arundo donax TaxID=35708 RepID=A0A0A8XYD7_ARUDO
MREGGRTTWSRRNTHEMPLLYSHPSLNDAKAEAPAETQRAASSCMARSSRVTLGVSPSNTHLFRCFHIIQAVTMIRVLSPFL